MRKPACYLIALLASVTSGCGSSPSSDGGIDSNAEGDAASDVDTLDDGGNDTGERSLCGATYEGDDAWSGRLVVDADARLCAYAPDEMDVSNEALLRALSKKSTVQFVPGTYPLPSVSGEAPFRIPMCVTDADSSSAIAVGAADEYICEAGDGISRAEGFYVNAAMTTGDDEFEINFVRPPEASEVRIDGTPKEEHFMGVHGSRGGRLYASCYLRPNRCSEVRVPGIGTGRIEEHIWTANPGRGFASVARFSGNVDDRDVNISAYDQLTTVYGRHAFDRSHFIRISSNSNDERCGIRIELSDIDHALNRAAYARCDGTLSGDWVPLELLGNGECD